MHVVGDIGESQVQGFVVCVLSLEMHSSGHACDLQMATHSATFAEHLVIRSTCVHMALLHLTLGEFPECRDLSFSLEVDPTRLLHTTTIQPD